MTHRDAILELDRRYVWRPYTSHVDHRERDPLVVVRAEGPYLFDADGGRYIDGNGSWWVSTLGHNHPRLRRALIEQSERLMHCSLAGVTHEPAARLAEELIAVAPGMARVFYSDDGSTAVEVALKIAFQYWQQNGRPKRTRFIALASAYHGDTLGAVSVSDIAEFRAVFGPMLFDVVHVGSVEGIEAVLRDRGDEIAGVLVEPLLQGATGMRVWPREDLARLRRATTEADTFLIADEVFTGYGRTGAMWACELAGVVPDLMCTAKGFSGGVMPFSATLASQRVYDGFEGGGERALMHGHSFCGNPLGAAIAREVLAIYRDEDVVGQVQRKAPLVRDAFERIATGIADARNARSIGMVGAIDLGEPGYHARLGRAVCDEARSRGVYLRALGNTIYVAPPLTTPVEVLEALLEVVSTSIATVLGG